MTTHAQCADEGGEQGHVGGGFFCMSVRAKLFWRTIYCTNQRPNTDSYSGFLSCRRLRRWSPRIMQEYDLETKITIRLLNHAHMYEMGCSSSPPMSILKFERKTRSSLPSMPYTERKKVETFLLLVVVLTMLVVIFILPKIQELIRWLILVGIWVGISKYDVDYSISLTFP